jgi:hypothetical protein
MTKIQINDTLRDMTSEEENEFQTGISKRPAMKLNWIRDIRLGKLEATDFWFLRGNITEAQTNYRQALRDIPVNFTTEEQYDLLLERNLDGTLKHSIWSKP